MPASCVSSSEPRRPPAALGDVQAVAALCACSPRHVYRMADAGRMPAPVRLGNLVRWDLAAIERWIADGCPPVRRAGGREAMPRHRGMSTEIYSSEKY
jgi:excisionase family DNA binding protein